MISKLMNDGSLRCLKIWLKIVWPDLCSVIDPYYFFRQPYLPYPNAVKLLGPASKESGFSNLNQIRTPQITARESVASTCDSGGFSL